jgi:protein-S-isoprenylcysteine O-methyltransferase Ste14
MHLLYKVFLFAEFAAAGIVFAVLMFVSAPYGKHYRKGWGISIDSRTAWLISELPAVFIIAILFLANYTNVGLVNILFLLFWEIHYIYRTFVFSLRLRGSKKSFPVLLVALAFLFNCINGFINGYYLFVVRPTYNLAWLLSAPFVIGTILYVFGLTLHIRADATLRSLRKPGETEYKTPTSGIFKYITNPNYLGETVQWFGWALMTFSLPGLAFAVFTAANLLPRAISNHKWYQTHFPEYTISRRALIPFVF